jgi:hypothetical protein
VIHGSPSIRGIGVGVSPCVHPPASESIHRETGARKVTPLRQFPGLPLKQRLLLQMEAVILFLIHKEDFVCWQRTFMVKNAPLRGSRIVCNIKDIWNTLTIKDVCDNRQEG